MTLPKRLLSLFTTALAVLAMVVVGASAATAQGDVDDPALVEAGLAIYGQACADCHSADGSGSPAGPPLTNIALREPDRSVHIDYVTNGKGQNMPAFGEFFSAEDIDAVVSYVRLSFTDDVAAQTSDTLPATGGTNTTLIFVGLALIGFGALTVQASTRLSPARRNRQA